MNKKLITMPLISALILTFASCGEKYFTADGETWGTSYHIVYKSADNIDSLIRGSLAATDAELSMFNPASTVSAVNAGLTDSVSDAFAEVFDLARRVSSWSTGAYDPTVGALTELWGFGRGYFAGAPADSAIAAALSTVGITDCRIEPGGRLVRKSEGTVFDFSSIAKGYGIDCIGRLFDSRGITDYMIEIGGEVLVCGVSPRKAPWRIQIDAPESGLSHMRLAVAELGPEAVALASSGNYRNYRVDSTGTMYGHTLSPLSGRPVRSEVIAATVLAPDCATADAVATACMAAGTAAGAQAIADSAAVSLMLVVASADTARVIVDEGFKKYLRE